MCTKLCVDMTLMRVVGGGSLSHDVGTLSQNFNG